MCFERVLVCVAWLRRRSDALLWCIRPLLLTRDQHAFQVRRVKFLRRDLHAFQVLRVKHLKRT